jgi:hypothetical protein
MKGMCSRYAIEQDTQPASVIILFVNNYIIVFL